MTAPNQMPPLPGSEPASHELSEDPIVLGLKQLYDSVLEEPVPHDFLALLSQIDETLAQQKDERADEQSSEQSGRNAS